MPMFEVRYTGTARLEAETPQDAESWVEEEMRILLPEDNVEVIAVEETKEEI